MATIIATKDGRHIKGDCAYVDTHISFKGEKRYVCNCIYCLLPESCDGCKEYNVAPKGLAKFAEQAELFETHVVEYQLAAKARDEAEAERARISEWLVAFLKKVPRDTKGKIKLSTAHHNVSLVEPVSKREWDLEKVRALFSSKGTSAVIKRKMAVDIDVPAGVSGEDVSAAIGRALKRVNAELKFTATDVKETVSAEAIESALGLGVVTMEELKPVCREVAISSYPKVSDSKEALVREVMI